MDMRSRVDYQIKATDISKEHYPLSCASKTWFNGASAGQYLNGSRRLMQDVVIPRFHQRQKAGERFFNNMYKEEVTVSAQGSGATWTSVADVCPDHTKSMTRVGSGYVAMLTPRDSVPNSYGHRLPINVPSLSSGEIYRAQKEVSTEVWSKIGTGDSELWESIAEYRQALELFQNPITRLKDLSSRFLKSIERDSLSRRFAKEVSDGYLMYRYGISPLMKDIKDILASLDKAGGHKEVTSRAKQQVIGASVQNSSTDMGDWIAYWQRQSNHAVTIRGMRLDSGYVSFANNLGLNFRSFALLPVQLTSYSFVADWFSNLSSYVRSTIPAFGWSPIGGCLVTTEVISTSYTLTSSVSKVGASNVLSSFPSGSTAIIASSTSRQPLLDASFVSKSDFGFDKPTRVADALGLIASRFVKVNALLGPRPNNSAYHSKKAYERWADYADRYSRF